MRSLCLSLLLLSAVLVPAALVWAEAATPPDVARALIVHALREGACTLEGDGGAICVFSAVLMGGTPATQPVARETRRQALYVTVIAAPTPTGVLVLRATGHQERWAPAGERLAVSMVFLDLLHPEAAYGEAMTFVHRTELETSQRFTPSPEEIQGTLALLQAWFLAPRDVI